MTFIDALPAAAPTSVPAVAAHPARFTGDPRAYWRILIRGAFLLAVTLGIYRFWLATDVRRFLWSHTELNGESFEYTGTALELLIGFLIAIALLIPIYVGFFLVTLSMGPFGELASMLAFPLLAYLGQFAVYRARRYRLTRTVYRGVRFHQTGSAWRYATCALFWWVMIALTLGLAYPFAQASLNRLKMRNTWFGNLPGRFEGSGFNLFLRGLLMWLLVMGPMAVALFVGLVIVDWEAVGNAAGSGGFEEFIGRLEGAAPGFYAAVVIGIASIVVSVLLAIVLFPAFQALMLRWWSSGVRFGELTITSHLRTGHIYGAYLRCLLYGLLLLIVASIVAVIAYMGLAAMFASSAGTERSEIAGVVAGLVFYVFLMLGLSTIYQATAKLSLWRYGVESLEINGLAVLDKVTAQGTPSSAVGEGLADALNVGGI